MENLLEIKNLFAKTENKQILKGLNLTIKKGETHVVMGPNGAGKSTLLNVILNNPNYKKTKGQIIFDNVDITNESTTNIARLGVFMSFQTPQEIEGISVFNFLKTAKSKQQEKTVNYFELKEELDKITDFLDMNKTLITRDLNVGFSGGEKKKNEILQMLALNPKLAVLDETDSGLDVDAIKTVSKGIKSFKNENNAILLITHSSKMLKELNPDFVHILIDGKIITTGGVSLIEKIEKEGYKSFL